MPPPSALSIKTSSVIRLIKEEASYHKEAVAQEKVIEKLEKEGGDEYELRQQVRLPRWFEASRPAPPPPPQQPPATSNFKYYTDSIVSSEKFSMRLS